MHIDDYDDHDDDDDYGFLSTFHYHSEIAETYQPRNPGCIAEMMCSKEGISSSTQLFMYLSQQVMDDDE
jgi:hypothetical protein